MGGNVRRGPGAIAKTRASAASVNCSVRNISTLQSKKEADLRRTAAGGAAHNQQARDAVDGVFNRLGDSDLHLFDRHYPVVHAYDHTWKVGFGKDRDGHLERHVDAGKRQQCEEEEDGLGGGGEPE